MQAVTLSAPCSFRGPSTEVATPHLIRPLGRCLSNLQADQQARHQGGIHLEAYPADPLTRCATFSLQALDGHNSVM